MIQSRQFVLVASIFLSHLASSFEASASPPTAAQNKSKAGSLLLFSKDFRLDRSLWSYYAPGSLTPRGLLPLDRTEGLLIKNAGKKDLRRTILIRGVPLTRDFRSACLDLKSPSNRVEIDPSGLECTVIDSGSGRERVKQWMYRDLRALKIVSFNFPYAGEHSGEAAADLLKIRTALNNENGVKKGVGR